MSLCRRGSAVRSSRLALTGGFMKISDIDFDVLKDLVTSVPSNMELLSIEFPDGNIRLHFVVDLSIIAKDRYNSSLQGLLSLLDGFD